MNPASDGTGPLLQRDFWAFVESPRIRACEIGAFLAHHLVALAPEDYVRFRRTEGDGPLAENDVLAVTIRLAGTFRVRVTDLGDNSLTLATLAGHPEAGRITFGGYLNHEGDLILHIRSRARSSTPLQRAAFVTVGASVQTNCWGELVKTVAATIGDGVVGAVHEETSRLPEDLDDDAREPTYLARGG